MSSRRKRIIVVFLLAVAATTLLSACSSAVDIYIQRGERWRVEEKLELPKNLGRVGVGIEGLGIEVPLDTEIPLTFAFNQIAALCPQHNWVCKVDKSSKGGEIAYRLTAKGQGYASLESFFNLVSTELGDQFQGESEVNFPTLTVREEGGLVHIAESAAGSQPENPELLALINSLFPVKVSVHGKEIISSNADEVKGGTAIWHSPRPIDVTLVPGSGLSLPATLGLVFGGVLVVAGLAFGIFKFASSLFSRVPATSSLPAWENGDIGETEVGDDWDSYGPYEDGDDYDDSWS